MKSIHTSLLLVLTLSVYSYLPGQTYFDNLDSALVHRDICTELDLDLAATDTFPSEVFELENLEYLLIRYYNGKKIPAGLNRLRKLSRFVMCYGGLSVFPDELCELPNIETIDLLDNEIAVIPKCISNCEHLKKMSLRSNPVSEIPTSVYDMDNLKTFVLGYPDDRKLPVSTRKLIRIKRRLKQCRCEFNSQGYI